jgi:hypothetical protein
MITLDIRRGFDPIWCMDRQIMFIRLPPLPTFASENRETQLVWNTPSGGFLDGDLAVADPDNKLATSICHTAWIDMKRWLRRQQGLTTHPIM